MSKRHYSSSRRPPPVGSRNGGAATVYVGSIPWDADEDEVMEACSVFGSIVGFKLVRDLNNPERKHRGFGFMEFADEEAALSAIRNHKGLLCRRRQLRISHPTNNNIKQQKKKPASPAINKKPNNIEMKADDTDMKPNHKRIINNVMEPRCNQKPNLHGHFNNKSSNNINPSIAGARPYPTISEDQPKTIKERKRSHSAIMTTGHIINSNNCSIASGPICLAILEDQPERTNEKKRLHSTIMATTGIIGKNINPYPANLLQDLSKKINKKKRILSDITNGNPDNNDMDHGRTCSLFYCTSNFHESKRQNMMTVVVTSDVAVHAHPHNHLTMPMSAHSTATSCNRVDTEVSRIGTNGGPHDQHLLNYSCIPPAKTPCELEADLLKLVDLFSRIHIHHQ